MAEGFLENTSKIKSLTAERAVVLVAKLEGSLFLNGLTSNKEVAKQRTLKVTTVSQRLAQLTRCR